MISLTQRILLNGRIRLTLKAHASTEPSEASLCSGSCKIHNFSRFSNFSNRKFCKNMRNTVIKTYRYLLSTLHSLLPQPSLPTGSAAPPRSPLPRSGCATLKIQVLHLSVSLFRTLRSLDWNKFHLASATLLSTPCIHLRLQRYGKNTKNE